MAIKLDRLAGLSFNNNLIDVSELSQQVAKQVKVSYFVADENLVQFYGTKYEIQKEFRFIKKDVDVPSGVLNLRLETMSNLGTTEVGIFLDNNIDPKKEFYTNGTNFQLLEGTMYIGNINDGVHLMKIGLRNLNLGTSFQRLTEIHGISI